MIKPFIDAHVHLNTLSAASFNCLNAMGAHFLSINTDVPGFIALEGQQGAAETVPGVVQIYQFFQF